MLTYSMLPQSFGIEMDHDSAKSSEDMYQVSDELTLYSILINLWSVWLNETGHFFPSPT